MTLEELASIGEALSGIGVIVTVLYLAFELRTNTKTIRANARSEGQLSLAAYNELLATNPEIAEMFERLIRENSVESFSEAQMFQITILIRAMIQRFEAQYFQYEAGIIEERVWLHRRRWLKSFLSIPGIDEWWSNEMESSILTPDFVSNIMTVTDGFDMQSLGQVKE